MYGGRVNVPLVVRSMIGKSWGQGAQHSQGLHSFFMHVPGIKVVAPVDALRREGLPRRRDPRRRPGAVRRTPPACTSRRAGSAEAYTVEPGKARVAVTGDDVTIVGISYMQVEVPAGREVPRRRRRSRRGDRPDLAEPAGHRHHRANRCARPGGCWWSIPAWTNCGAAAEIVGAGRGAASGRARLPLQAHGLRADDVPDDAGAGRPVLPERPHDRRRGPRPGRRPRRRAGCRRSAPTCRASSSRGRSECPAACGFADVREAASGRTRAKYQEEPRADHQDRAGQLNWPLMKNNIAREDLDAVIELAPAGRPDPDAVEERARVRGGVVALARREAQRVRQLRVVGQPRHAGRAQGAARRRRRGDRPDAHLGVRHRGRAALRVHAGVRGHRPAHAGHGHRRRSWRRSRPRRGPCSSRTSSGYNALSQQLLDELKRAQRPAHRRRVRVARGDVRRPQARHVRLGVELLVLLRAPPQHHRRRDGLHRTTRTCTKRCACSARTAWCASWTRDEPTPRVSPTSIPDLNPDFIFAFAGVQRAAAPRSTPSWAARSCAGSTTTIQRRTENLSCSCATSTRTCTAPTSRTEGSSNYAFTLILRGRRPGAVRRVMRRSARDGVEFRRGTAGGGNQLRQPYLRRLVGAGRLEAVPAGGPRPLLRLLHRQLPDARSASESSRCATCSTAWAEVGLWCGPPACIASSTEDAGGTPAQGSHHAEPSRPRTDQPEQPDAGVPVARHRPRGRREPGVGRADGDLLPRAGAVRRDHRRRGRGPGARRRWPTASRT